MENILDVRFLTDPGADRFRALAYMMAGLMILIVILLVGSVLSALWMRLAAVCVGVKEASFGRCYRACVLANFVVAMTALGIVGFFVVNLGRHFHFDELIRWLVTNFRVDTLVYASAAFVLVHAAIFSTVCRSEEGRPLSVGPSAALAVVYLAISAFMGIVINMILWALLPQIVIR
jgi:hypothetical protein